MQIKRFDMRRIRLQSHTLSGLIQYPGLARLWKRYFSLHPGIEWFVYLAVFVIGVGGTYSLLWRDPLYALYEARLQTEALSKQYQLHRARLKAAIDLHDKVADKKKEFSQQWSRMFTHQPLSRVLEDVQRLAHQFFYHGCLFFTAACAAASLVCTNPFTGRPIGGLSRYHPFFETIDSLPLHYHRARFSIIPSTHDEPFIRI